MDKLIKCEWCEGIGIDGYDRCYPRNPYDCYSCDGTGKVTIKRNKVMKFICSIMYPEKSKITYSCAVSALQEYEIITGDYYTPRKWKCSDEEAEREIKADQEIADEKISPAYDTVDEMLKSLNNIICRVCKEPFEVSENVRQIDHDEVCNFVHGKCLRNSRENGDTNG